MSDDDPAYYRVPDDDQMISQLLYCSTAQTPRTAGHWFRTTTAAPYFTEHLQRRKLSPALFRGNLTGNR